MNQLYDNYLETSLVGGGQCEWKIKQLEVNYRRFFPEDKTAHVLDIGIGSGEMLKNMQEWGFSNYEGIDISESAVKACKELGYHCTLVQNTSEFLNNNPGKYAVITLFHVIEHIPQNGIISFIEDCRKALAPGGVLLIETPNMASIDGLLMRYNDFTHVMGYTMMSLRQMLLLSGFQDIEIFETNVMFPKKFKIRIMRFLSKIQRFIKNFERRVDGMRLETLPGVFISAAVRK
ncbi:MAG: class I SAM-dependent methyltransferase [Lentisphaeria bacterium]|nr:class I SAM-dependent methyltransferase [Lentisphaeria bacterium]